MNNKLRRLTESTTKAYLLALIVFAAVTLMKEQYILAGGELIIILLLMLYSLLARRQREKQLAQYIESVTYDTDSAKNNTLVHFPLPIAVFRLEDSGISWANEMFFSLCDIQSNRLDARITDVASGFNSKWLTEGKSEIPTPVEVKGRLYQVHGNLVRSEKPEDGNAFMGITYWIDITDYEQIKARYKDSRPVAGIIVIDNLEELYRNQPERAKNDTRDAVEDLLNAWVEKNGGIIRRYERDSYITLFENKALSDMRADKFEIIQQVHSVKNPAGIEASISIGLGIDGESYQEVLQYAAVGCELALSRGGDQAVIKNRLNFEFYGGRGGEVEKRTKVRSRVMANTLAELMRESSEVFVMGHRFADYDAVGAAVGVCCITRKLGVKSYIVINKESTAAGPLIDRLLENELYKDCFITPQEAMMKAGGKSLLVVVDTNRPEQVEDVDLLESIPRVAVIDHHRVSATRIQNAAMGFVEPYASSACELLTEILQEVTDPGDITRLESDALLAGICLDTKNFTLRTGERTFEAAAYLRRAGADTISVKKLFQNGMDATIEKYRIMQQAKLYHDVVVMAVTEETHGRVALAQAADELLNVSGVEASIVASPDGNGNTSVSARSIGDMNVQIIMENIGGGGNKNAAAALLSNTDPEAAQELLRKAIDDYFG